MGGVSTEFDDFSTSKRPVNGGERQTLNNFIGYVIWASKSYHYPYDVGEKNNSENHPDGACPPVHRKLWSEPFSGLRAETGL